MFVVQQSLNILKIISVFLFWPTPEHFLSSPETCQAPSISGSLPQVYFSLGCSSPNLCRANDFLAYRSQLVTQAAKPSLTNSQHCHPAFYNIILLLILFIALTPSCLLVFLFVGLFSLPSLKCSLHENRDLVLIQCSICIHSLIQPVLLVHWPSIMGRDSSRCWGCSTFNSACPIVTVQ